MTGVRLALLYGPFCADAAAFGLEEAHYGDVGACCVFGFREWVCLGPGDLSGTYGQHRQDLVGDVVVHTPVSNPQVRVMVAKGEPHWLSEGDEADQSLDSGTVVLGAL